MASDWNTTARWFTTTAVAHVATLMSDGAPQATPVWIDRHGDTDLAIFTEAGSLKDRNLARDPRIAISITDPDNPLSMATVRGEVVERITGDAAWEVIDRIAIAYTGAPYERGLEYVALVIRPTRWRSQAYED